MTRKKLAIKILVIALVVAASVAVLVHGARGLIDTRLDANERWAYVILKNIFIAQITYSLIPGLPVPEEGGSPFARNYRLLYYTPDPRTGKPVGLISKRMADAFLLDNPLSGPSAPSDAPARATPESGYYFIEDITERIPDSERATRPPAVLAFPAEYGITGNTIFWAGGTDGTVYRFNPKAPKGTTAAELARRLFSPTPAGGMPVGEWRELK